LLPVSLATVSQYVLLDFFPPVYMQKPSSPFIDKELFINRIMECSTRSYYKLTINEIIQVKQFLIFDSC